MDTKEYLRQIERLEKQIENKLAEIYQLKTMACSVTVSSDKERVQSSSDKDRLGSTVAKIVDLENETDELVNSFIAKRNMIIGQIDAMEDADIYNILSERYVGKNTFDDIAKKMNYSKRQVIRLHGKALIDFEKRYGNQYKE